MTNFEITALDVPGNPAAREQIMSLLSAAERADGVAPLSEAFLNGLSDDRLNHKHLVLGGDKIEAVAATAPDGGVELGVDPGLRRQGRGTALVAHVLEDNAEATLWAHGNLPAAAALAEKFGLSVGRQLLVMAVEGEPLEKIAHLDAPEGYTDYSYTQAADKFGKDNTEQDWLRVNNDAFSWHPEQGGWELADLHRGMEAEWFDPEGVRLLYQGDNLAGFHWTKMHSHSEGEVYVVGLSSDFRGQGLGDPLMRAGLAHLWGKGARRVILYVEADNQPAVRRYEEMGFSVAEDHVVYQRA